MASSGALLAVYVYSIVTGLLVAEVNINTMCELGQGGVSISSMAERTLGRTGARAASAAYLFLHYALLVACALLRRFSCLFSVTTRLQ